MWNGIYNSLHTRRKWFGLGIILLLLTGTSVTLLVTHSPKETIITTSNKPVTNKKITTPDLQASADDKLVGENKFYNNTSIVAVATNRKTVLPVSNSYSEPANSLTSGENNLQVNDDPVSISNNDLKPIETTIVDELTDQDIINTTSKTTSTYPTKLNAYTPFNWTIESVLNSFKHFRNKRFSLQLSFTPTISYRKLSANKAFLHSANLQSNSPSSFAALYDVNNVVTHKPDIGLELGVTSKYALSNNLRIKAGIQFNVNRYDIKAFNYPWEMTTIALRTSTGVDSVSTPSSHRNFNGYKSDWLQNFYFEISMPVGVEVNIAGDDRVKFGVGGTIQPTYVLGDRAYLLSTDYKNYAEVPWLIRRWNVSAGLETFVSYSTGKMKWQVGPQVRYQLLSSFVAQYPVKENLFDFGLKVGVSLNR